jgi:acyl-CoA synthetase (NDP forming)
MRAEELIQAARAAGRTALDEAAGKRLLAQFGIAVPRSVTLSPQEAAGTVLAGLRPPFVLKVLSPDILHKSDVGGVKVGLADAAAVDAAVQAMREAPQIAQARLDGFLLEEMAPAGQEVVVGGLRDPQFGPLVMVGLGGIFVEILEDVAFRICPITRLDASEMLDELRGKALLAGARGGAPVSREALIEVLLRVGGAGGLLMTLAEEIDEVDLNPVIASEHGAVAVDARLILRDARQPAEPPSSAASLPPQRILEVFEPLIAPKTIAVVGASATSMSAANVFIRRMREFGYAGRMFPIHPSAAAVDGLPAYRSVPEAPEPIDYLYISVAAQHVPGMLAAAGGRVRFAQVISSGFGEVDEGKALQEELVSAARAGGLRVLGPNCLGLYSPRGRVTFVENGSTDLGRVGIISQSGGLGTDIVRRGQVRGLRFSAAITIGNSADIGPSDLLEYYLADSQTQVIGLYLEAVRDGRRLFELLDRNRAAKPVVILKGGRTQQGRLAAASHTGSLAGDDRVWIALSRQTGCLLVDTLDQFLDTLLIFQGLKPRGDAPTREVVMFGNGGGTSVLATDLFARLELRVTPFAQPTLDALKALKLPPGSSITNPIDTPVGTLQQEEGRIAEKILDAIFATADPQALVMHLNMAAFVGRTRGDVLGNLMQAALRVQSRYPGRAHFVLVLRSDGVPDVEARKREFRDQALALGIPVYDEMMNVGWALAALARHERFLHGRAHA